ncbi:LLM class flavin-dependent oxidoreductase [Actinoplanes sp. M2I2]|uniref:LLM class flavin-dependent oxidoreductase n=1 Tax=Actinoplanes sp. M2I2 TaxID=1734444 RepID=UPI0020218026|nr:LLM class flavin-dependent oxidoreductase [Actinoplanes sp. M2I2]
MKIGIGLPNQVRDVDASLLPRWARMAEEAGFSTLGTVGRIAYPGVMDTVALAAAAGATSRIGLFSNVLLGPVWPPALLAKEAAGIDGVSGGRLTLGLGIGARPDDFVAEAHGPRGLGKRLDRDLAVYRDVWQGKAIGDGPNPAVPAGTREVPLMFGGFAPAAMTRMATWGQGYIGASIPPVAMEGTFAQARAAWSEAGRQGGPRLVAICYFALSNSEAGRANIYDYYSLMNEDFAQATAAGVWADRDGLRAAVRQFEAIGADELIFNPATADLDDLVELAETVL